ncbi:MAG: ABC transporter ATP-binding protein [Oscillospiraceae bacterium]|nr:ABC transporter ATP-binding protein [Oscillospiraceae bacterium]
MTSQRDETENILSLRNLLVRYPAEKGTVYAVNGVSLQLKKGQTLGLAGETGAGKTTTALALMRMLPDPGLCSCEELKICGTDMLKLSKKQLERFRRSEISMIFQDPMSALNPVFSVGQQIADAVMLHAPTTRRDAWRKAEKLLETVGIPSVRAVEYPHELSGGMKQRVLIAIALACNPKVLIADEPTTALDVTIQAQILAELETLRKERGMSMILISHNLAVIRHMADEIIVMYLGQIIEKAPNEELFLHPMHPYTRALLAAVPDPEAFRQMPRMLLRGEVTAPVNPGSTCRFFPRCPCRSEECRTKAPLLRELSPGHYTACILESAAFPDDTGPQTEKRATE